MYVLDTNICIYLMRRQPPEVVERLSRLTRGDVVMSCVTLAELEFGVALHGAARPEFGPLLAELVQWIPALPFDAAASRAYGVLRAAVPGRDRNALDRLIAAQTISLNAVLVTNNIGDFKDYPGLRLENWVQAD
jgi:tRNA(fMet)-specific endonuclease VapC